MKGYLVSLIVWIIVAFFSVVIYEEKPNFVSNITLLYVLVNYFKTGDDE